MGVYSSAVLADSPTHYWRCFENFGALALEDIGSATAYLYASGIPVTGGGAGVSTVPGLGWSGVASDGGSFAASGAGFKNFKPTSGSFPVGPGVEFPVPGSLEFWNWNGEPDSGVQVGWFFPGQPVNQQLVQLIATLTEIQAQAFGAFFVTDNTIATNHWHHCVMTLSSTTMGLFVDGSSVGSTAVTFSGSSVAQNFFAGQTGIANDSLQQTGFIAEIAMYDVVLGAGQVANHFAAADSRTNQPVFYGTRPQTVPNPRGLALGTAHTGLTGQSSFSTAAGTIAALISVTVDAPQYGEIIGNPDYLMSRGYITASNALGSVYEFNRLVFGTQVRFLPPFTSVISWSLAAGVTVTITELFLSAT